MPPTATRLTAFEACNKHGLWASDAIDTPFNIMAEVSAMMASGARLRPASDRDAEGLGHAPIVAISGGSARVSCPKSTTTQFLWAKDQNNASIAAVSLRAGEEPVMLFSVPKDATRITAFQSSSRCAV